MTIYVAVIENNMGFPGLYKTTLMMVATTISSWQFINVSSILAALLKVMNKETNEELAAEVGVVTPSDVSVEHELFGTFNVLTRAIAGSLSCIAVCVFSLGFAYINYQSVLTNKVYAGELESTVVMVGPMIMSWTFMRASVTLKQVLKIDAVGNALRWLSKRLTK